MTGNFQRLKVIFQALKDTFNDSILIDFCLDEDVDKYLMMLRENHDVEGLANTYEIFGHLNRNLSLQLSYKQEFIGKIVGGYFIYLSALHYVAVKKGAYAETLLKGNYYYLINKLSQWEREGIREVHKALTLELIGHSIALFNLEEAHTYFRKAQDLFQCMERMDQLGETSDYYWNRITEEMIESLDICFHLNIKIPEDGYQRINLFLNIYADHNWLIIAEKLKQ